MTAMGFMHVGAVQAYSSRLAVNFARVSTMVIRFFYLRSGVNVAPCWLFQPVAAGNTAPTISSRMWCTSVWRVAAKLRLHSFTQ